MDEQAPGVTDELAVGAERIRAARRRGARVHRRAALLHTQLAAGSFNYTQPANDYNDENLFVLGSVFPQVEQIKVNKTACQALARFMKAEIDRIITGSTPYVP